MDQNDRAPDPGMEPPATAEPEATTAIGGQEESTDTGETRRSRIAGRASAGRAAGRPSTRSRGPTASKAKGADRELDERPGVPMETEPSPDEGAHWEEPERQDVTVPHLKREGLGKLTPVVGTAQPPRGLSGVMRRMAYGVPEHQARHWGILLAADRVDVIEDRLGRGFGVALRTAGLRQLARRVERNPLPMLAGAVVAGMVVSRAIRNSR